MEKACEVAEKPCIGDKAKNVLFDCVPGITNSIKLSISCSGKCVDGGAGKSDYCGS